MATMAEKKEQLNVRLDEDLVARLRMIAAVEDRSLVDLVGEAVDELVRRRVADPGFQKQRNAWIATLKKLV